jgi:alkylhydroperoxidase family enzyme
MACGDIIALMSLPHHLQKAIDALFRQPGETEASLRRAVLQRNRSGAGQVPDALHELVDKVADRPWTLSDEDFTRLRAAGYSEGQLYEITLAAALGAGLERFDAGLRAIEEAS